jgi:signal transduction histidine kinase
LEPLLDRVRVAGLQVRCTVRGDTSTLSQGLQLAVYRIVQESLTNTLKHADDGTGARATAAQVTLNCAEGTVDIEVTDTGHGHAAPAGRGISGMRERAAVYDGTLQAGPAAGGGWRVRCHLPVAAEERIAPWPAC